MIKKIVLILDENIWIRMNNDIMFRDFIVPGNSWMLQIQSTSIISFPEEMITHRSRPKLNWLIFRKILAEKGKADLPSNPVKLV
jgi:hypothetical protein